MNDDLISRSALIDELVKGGIFPAMVRRTIERAPAVEAAPARWIPATERLPDNDNFVLVVASGQAGNIRLDNAIELGQFSISEGWILELWPEWEDPKITYWMPLPELPAAGMKENSQNKPLFDADNANEKRAYATCD